MPDLNELRDFVDGVLRRDGHDLETVKSAARTAPIPGVEPVPGAPGKSESATLEAIISLHRPVFAIRRDLVEPTLTSNGLDPEASEMKKLVEANAARINETIRAIGRIDLPGDEVYPWAGTGWLVDSELGSDIIATNAHVAVLFAEANASGVDFRKLPFAGDKLEAPILDFRRERSDAQPRRFKVLEVIYIGTPNQLDVAFLRVAKAGEAEENADRLLAKPLSLAASDPAQGLAVATIGYPGTDRGDYDVETLMRIFGHVFDTKRCSPGRIMGRDARGITHDCSSMPGSSGSAVIDVKTGEIVGLHFQGTPFRSNHAVPVTTLKTLIRERPWHIVARTDIRSEQAGDAQVPSRTQSDLNNNGAAEMKVSIVDNKGGVKITLPLEITVRIGDGSSGDAAPQHTKSDTPLSLEAATKQVDGLVGKHSNVVRVRGTYLFDANGKLTEKRGVVVLVRPEASRSAADYGLPATLGGVPVSVEMVDLPSLASKLAGENALDSGLEAPATMQAYKRNLKDERFNLDPVTADMTLVLHVSPEAGWRELSKFFENADCDSITIGMYNFTAPHIIEAVRAAITPDGRNTILTLDRKTDDIGKGNKADDWPEEKVMKSLKRDAKNQFDWTPASVSGKGRLFATSYHIKVAVLGKGEAFDRFWLSSGNWASSNQAPFGDADHPLEDLTWSDVKSYDRDWHAVVQCEPLATTFHNHLKQDFVDCRELEGEEAAAPLLPELIVPEDYFLEAPRAVREYKAIAPKVLKKKMTVQPVLTPDNYPEIVIPLIKSARDSVLFINQSFDVKEEMPPHYQKLLEALLDRQQRIRDVRIIFRSGYGKERDIFRNAVEFGFDKDKIRFYGTCHTKGIVVDGQKVLLGSQNWTGSGTKFNRDASLLIEDDEAAEYFTEIFEFDWKIVATDRVAPDHGPSRPVRTRDSDEEAPVPLGFRTVPWGAWEGT